MDFYQNESCFVCDKNIVDKGVWLSVEKTYYSKTAFPTKLGQMLGDSFMVVVSEDDKLCVRCANLINRLDKFEHNLMKIKNIIVEFLSAKYDLNQEGKLPFAAEELEEKTNDDSVCDINFKCSSTKKAADEKSIASNNLRPSKRLQETNSNVKKASGLEIKPEPAVYSSERFNGSGSHYVTNVDDQIISEVLMRKLPEDDSSQEEILSPLNSSSNGSIKTSQELQDFNTSILDAVKVEKLSADYHCNSSAMSTVHETNHSKDINDGAKELASAVENELSCNQKNNTLTTDILSDTNLQKSVAECKLSKYIKKKASSKKVTPRCRKRIKKEQAENSVRKLRPILPKIPDLNGILSSLCIVQNSHCNGNIEISNQDHINTISETEVANNIKKITTKNINVETKPNQYLFQKVNVVDLKEGLPKSNISCKICNTYFLDSKALEIHAKKHLKDGDSHKCSFCTKIFKTKSGLRNHEASHTGKYAFWCDFCGQGFTTRIHMEEHRSSHTKEERYVCDVCGKKFNFQSTYWIHRKWHDNPFPYKCNECNKPFRHSSLLAVHRRKHTGERPYKCSYCPLTFAVSNSLRRHLVLHTKEYPYKCDTCNQGFTTRFRYTEHLARRHNIFVEKPLTDPKDYKMVVYDNVDEKSGSKLSSIVETVELGDRHCDLISNSEISFPDEASEGECQRIKIVFESSSLGSDTSMLLSDSWLT